MKHNNELPNNHYQKGKVKVWLDQAQRKITRRRKRHERAARLAPRPVDLLRPAVRCPTVRYNTKIRAGRGFTLLELKKAGIEKKEARTIGIAVDHRRTNRSVEALEVNVARLQAYMSKLIVFSRKNPQKNHAEVKQVQVDLMPITNVKTVLEEPRAITADDKERKAYNTLRVARSNARLVGLRAKKLMEAAEAEQTAAKAK